MLNQSTEAQLTCTREACHVLYSVHEDLVPLLRGQACPRCGLGVLELREYMRQGRPEPELQGRELRYTRRD